MSRLLKIVIGLFLFFVFASPAWAQYIGTCPDEDLKAIRANANGWRDSQPEFQKVPPPVPSFYDPYLNKNFPKNTHLDTTMLPNPDNLACLIAFAKVEWHDNYGTKFDDKNVEKVINFAINNNYNPSLFLALWAEESHGGDLSDRQFGCGKKGAVENYGLDNQLKCLSKIDPQYKLNSFACFLGSYAGDTPASLNCGYADPDGIVTNPDFPYMIQFYNYLTKGVHPQPQPTPSPIPVNFTVHPLRPYPYTLVKEETDKKISDSTLTPYCAMRPTAVQFNVHDKRDPTTKIYTIGTLTSNFQNFITPLLSITDPKKPDYTLSYPDKAQRYLADFLEGRAFYEPFTEPASPTLDQQTDLFTRLGVFRKLAPKTYQDKLKRALILRAAGQFNSADNPYGFPPATEQIQNYTVGYWDGANAWSPNDQHGQKITLKDFVNNWAPIPEDFDDSAAYALASAAWQIEDNAKWFKLWSYVPMFTREDTKGFIQVLDDTGPPGPQTSDKKEVAVIHPHLARTYEVATSLSYLLSPASTHDAPTPELEEKWYSPAPWDTETPWWMKSYTAGGELGQSVCDFKPAVSLISSSGDLAKDDLITTSVNRLEILAPNPFYEGPPSYDPKCNADLYPCEKCKNIPGLGYDVDDSDCRVVKDARYDPTYFFTYTPFLNQILTSLTESPRGIFDFFKTASASADKTVDWPGVGNPGEESPVYDFKSSNGQKSLAEAGFHKPGSNQSFLYRYLGTIQCAKEKVLAVLQPFTTGQPYTPYATDCFRQPGEPGPGAFGIPAVGCTDEKSPIDFDNTASSPIAQRAWEIVSDLYQGFWCYWNRSPGDFATDVTDYPPSYPELFDEALYAQIPNPTPEQIYKQYFNMFWCTWLVTKAFNETGLSMPTNLLYTPDMVQWFKDRGKYIEAAGATYQDVAPGDAIFFQIPPDYGRINHTAIVYSVNEDGITTVESNAGYKTMFYPTDTNGNIQTMVGEIKIEGFGKP